MPEFYQVGHVGSLLRSWVLKEARSSFDSDGIPPGAGGYNYSKSFGRSNRSKWYAEGGHEPMAEKCFGTLDFGRFLSEYGADWAWTFDPLWFVPKDKILVLGLLSNKEGVLEDQDELLRRIDEASKFFPLDNMALSPQCGFTSMAAGNL